MQVNDSLQTTYKDHIKTMKEKIKDFYTIDVPNDYHISDGKIDVSEELEGLKDLERVYSIIVQDGVKEGEIHSNYSTYLDNVRKAIVILEREKSKVEKLHLADIKNAQLIISVMNKNLNG